MNTITTIAAINTVINYTLLDRRDILSVNARLESGIYELELDTSFQHYEFFVDAFTAEVLGINAIPATDYAICEQSLAGVNGSDRNVA